MQFFILIEKQHPNFSKIIIMRIFYIYIYIYFFLGLDETSPRQLAVSYYPWGWVAEVLGIRVVTINKENKNKNKNKGKRNYRFKVFLFSLSLSLSLSGV
jgi:hypothetical protein